ncbi:MAG TPA: hypothetical protein VF899_20190 [Pyrinomonadaceae bacterium]
MNQKRIGKSLLAGKMHWFKRLNAIEKLNFAVSIVALIGGALGIFAFFKADATMEAFRHRGKLHVSNEVGQVRIVSPAPGTIFQQGEKVSLTARYETSTFKITNIGDLPSKDVLLVITYDESVTEPKDPFFTPTWLFDKTIQGNTFFYTLRRPIAPNAELIVKFTPSPNSFAAIDENGESSTIVLASVRFVGVDTTTKGNWKGVHGTEGSVVPAP